VINIVTFFLSIRNYFIQLAFYIGHFITDFTSLSMTIADNTHLKTLEAEIKHVVIGITTRK